MTGTLPVCDSWWVSHERTWRLPFDVAQTCHTHVSPSDLVSTKRHRDDFRPNSWAQHISVPISIAKLNLKEVSYFENAVDFRVEPSDKKYLNRTFRLLDSTIDCKHFDSLRDIAINILSIKTGFSKELHTEFLVPLQGTLSQTCKGHAKPRWLINISKLLLTSACQSIMQPEIGLSSRMSFTSFSVCDL